MFRKVIDSFARFKEWDRETTDRTTNKHMHVEKFSSLIVILTFFGSIWALAWYSHVLSPLLDSVLGIGPHDIDSIGKIRWRRIYSTVFCAPPMLYAIIRYAYNQWKK